MRRITAYVAGAAAALALAACGDDTGNSGRSAALRGSFPSQPVHTVSLCLSMAGSGRQVTGMQVDLSWEAGCMSPVPAEAETGDCTAAPATGKTLHTRLLPGSSLRALLLSLSDVDPIPDGRLFCCRFLRPAPSCCSLDLTNLIASDPTGEKVHDPRIVYQAALDGTPCAEVGG